MQLTRPITSVLFASLFILSGSASAQTPTRDSNTSAESGMPHNYVFTQDGEYGYEPAVSEADKMAGTVQKPLVMARYLGHKNGVYTAAITEDDMTINISCKMPCNFIKVIVRAHGQTSGPKVIPAQNTIGQAILEDAIVGNLDVYRAPHVSDSHRK